VCVCVLCVRERHTGTYAVSALSKAKKPLRDTDTYAVSALSKALVVVAAEPSDCTPDFTTNFTDVMEALWCGVASEKRKAFQ
jgi:hypothetical protein